MEINKYEMRNSEIFAAVFLMLSAMSNGAVFAESNASYVDLYGVAPKVIADAIMWFAGVNSSAG